MIGLEKLDDPDEIAAVEAMVAKHRELTQSKKAAKVLALWEEMVPKFVKVMPNDYKRVLSALKKAEAAGLSGDDALTAAFEENARDVARVGGG
jgi:glutamate synthase (ferredoxin)